MNIKKSMAVLIISMLLMLLLTACNTDDECGMCNGSGYYQKKTCPVCNGSGHSDYDPYENDIYD